MMDGWNFFFFFFPFVLFENEIPNMIQGGDIAFTLLLSLSFFLSIISIHVCFIYVLCSFIVLSLFFCSFHGD